MKSIIIAEDSKEFGSLVTFIIEKFNGIRVVGFANDGTELLRMVDAQPPDFILADIVMPGINGIEATRIIKQKHPSVRVFVMSSFDNRQYREGALVAGAEIFIPKDNLQETLEKLFS